MALRRPLVINSATGRKQELPSGDTLVGGDAWTVVKVTQDFTVSAVAFANILVVAAGAALGFTPAANTNYEFEGLILVQTATATVGPRVGLAWGTGYSYGAAEVRRPLTATTQNYAQGTIGTVAGTLQDATGGVPVAAVPYLATLKGNLLAGATPTALTVQVASSTAGTNVTIKAGSFIRYRTF